MPFFSGNTGGIKFGKVGRVNGTASSGAGSGWQTTDTKVTNWTLSTAAQLLDTTTLGDYDKSSVYGLRTTSGTLRLFYYTNGTAAATPANNSASWFLNALLRADTKSQGDANLPPNSTADESIACYLRLYLDTVSSGAVRNYIDLEANLTSVSYGSSVGELVAFDVTFEASGQPLISRA